MPQPLGAAIFVAVGGLFSFSVPVSAAELLLSQVTWRDGTGATGTGLFQGTSKDSALTGHGRSVLVPASSRG